MPTLAEITASEESLQAVADEVWELMANEPEHDDEMNSGIESNEQLTEIFSNMLDANEIDYSGFCEIGKKDY